MDGVSGASNGVAEINQIMQMMTTETMAMAKKMVRADVEMAVKGSEAGKGNAVDVAA